MCLALRRNNNVDFERDGKVFAVPRGSYVSGVKRMNTQYRGRPETIESVFYMWRITGDRKWQASCQMLPHNQADIHLGQGLVHVSFLYRGDGS